MNEHLKYNILYHTLEFLKRENKFQYEKISMQKLKSQVSENNKWKLIQEVQKEYKKYHKYSVVGKKFNIDDRTVKKYLQIKEPPVNGNKNREYNSKLSLYKNKIIKMNNEGFTWKMIKENIQKDGYNGSDSLLRTYLSKIKKEETKSKEINQSVHYNYSEDDLSGYIINN